MKNLKSATDFEIYLMRDAIQTFNYIRSSKVSRKMESQLDKEFKRRGIIVPLAWDLSPGTF
jgi:hypothetical protein